MLDPDCIGSSNFTSTNVNDFSLSTRRPDHTADHGFVDECSSTDVASQSARRTASLPTELLALARTGVTAWQQPRDAWLAILRHLPLQDHVALHAAACDEYHELRRLDAQPSWTPENLIAIDETYRPPPASPHPDLIEPLGLRRFEQVRDRLDCLPASAPPVYARARPEDQLFYLNRWIDGYVSPPTPVKRMRTGQTPAQRAFCGFAGDSLFEIAEILKAQADAATASDDEKRRLVLLHLEIFEVLLKLRDRFRYEPSGKLAVPMLLESALGHLSALTLTEKTAALGAFSDLLRVYDGDSPRSEQPHHVFRALKAQIREICRDLHRKHGFSGLPAGTIALSRLMFHTGDYHVDLTLGGGWGVSLTQGTPLWDLYRSVTTPSWRVQANAQGLASAEPVWRHLREQAIHHAVYSLDPINPDHARTLAEAAQRWDISDSCETLSFLACGALVNGALALSATQADTLFSKHAFTRACAALHAVQGICSDIIAAGGTIGNAALQTEFRQRNLPATLRELLADVADGQFPERLLSGLDISRYAPEVWPAAVECLLKKIENSHALASQPGMYIAILNSAFANLSAIPTRACAAIALQILEYAVRMQQHLDPLPGGQVAHALLAIVQSVAIALRDALRDAANDDASRDEIRPHYRALVIALHSDTRDSFSATRDILYLDDRFAADYLAPLDTGDLLNLFCCGTYIDSLGETDSQDFHKGIPAAIAQQPGLWNGRARPGRKVLSLYLDWAEKCRPADWTDIQRQSFTALVPTLEQSSFAAADDILRILRRRIFAQAREAAQSLDEGAAASHFAALKGDWGLPDCVTSMQLDAFALHYLRSKPSAERSLLPNLLALGVTDAWVIARAERAVASAVFHDIPADSPDRNTALVDLARQRGLSDRAILRGATLYPHTGFGVTSLYGTLHPNRRPQPIIGLTAPCPDSSTDPDRERA